jgi:hypothetical protein
LEIFKFRFEYYSLNQNLKTFFFLSAQPKIISAQSSLRSISLFFVFSPRRPK